MIREERFKVLITNTLFYFNKNKIIEKESYMLRENAKEALKLFKIEYGHKKLNLYQLLIIYRGYSIIKPSKDRNVIIFNLKRLKNILDHPDAVLPDVRNLVVINQHKSLQSQNKNKKNEPDPDLLKCYICNKFFNNKHNYNQHMNSKFHQKLKSVTQRDKDTSVKLDFVASENVIKSNLITLKKTHLPVIKLRLSNISSKAVNILDIQTLEVALKISAEYNFPIELKENRYIDIDTNLNIDNIEDPAFCEIIGYSFRNIEGQILKASKSLSFAINDEYYDEFYPISSYERKQKSVVKEIDYEIIPGQSLPATGWERPKKRLQNYKITPTLNVLINHGLKKFDRMSRNQTAELKRVKDILNVADRNNCLTIDNYYALLPLLLYLEEHQMNIDIREFDMESNDLKLLRNHFYELKVPGLAEQRPSIMRGDSVYVSEVNSRVKYEGIVHKICETTVELGFHPDFQKIYLPNKNLQVSFSFCRLPLKVQHQAVAITNSKLLHRLFPKANNVNTTIKKMELKLFNRNIKGNPEQLQAIKCILQNTSGIYPYIVFGPPGTGKTSTLVEAIKQIYLSDNLKKILVCASSNDAVNTITERLIDAIPSTDLLRYISFSYTMQNAPERMYKYVNIKNNDFYQPTLKDIQKFKIITTTLINAARIYNMGGENSFDYVFIDEAGHCTETESLIPLSCLLKIENGSVILAGDPKQLGPIIHSPIAKQYGFNVSMLERLMRIDLYKKNNDGKYDSRYVTKLLNNYRSHPAILEIPSKLFYDGELNPMGDNLINIAVGTLEYLKNKDFPVIFHHIVGKDIRENVSPSYFNVNEMQVVDKYLEMLYKNKLRGRLITGKDIGIITPYRRQVQKLQQMCSKRGYKDITVGSVEQFQGQEKLIIIISTVRSQSNLLHFDYKYHLGFLCSEKRFNVALTRPKALLIVIGNGKLLQLDPRFYDFIKYCQNNNAVFGHELIIMDEPPQDHVDKNCFSIEDAEPTPTHEDNINFSAGVNM